jgi:hypothetical protein
MTTKKTDKTSNKPTHTVRIKDWNSEQDNYLNIGVAWQKDNGTITVKLSGKLLIDDAIFLNPIKDKS